MPPDGHVRVPVRQLLSGQRDRSTGHRGARNRAQAGRDGNNIVHEAVVGETVVRARGQHAAAPQQHAALARAHAGYLGKAEVCAGRVRSFSCSFFSSFCRHAQIGQSSPHSVPGTAAVVYFVTYFTSRGWSRRLPRCGCLSRHANAHFSFTVVTVHLLFVFRAVHHGDENNMQSGMILPQWKYFWSLNKVQNLFY